MSEIPSLSVLQSLRTPSMQTVNHSAPLNLESDVIPLADVLPKASTSVWISLLLLWIGAILLTRFTIHWCSKSQRSHFFNTLYKHRNVWEYLLLAVFSYACLLIPNIFAVIGYKIGVITQLEMHRFSENLATLWAPVLVFLFIRQGTRWLTLFIRKFSPLSANSAVLSSWLIWLIGLYATLDMLDAWEPLELALRKIQFTVGGLSMTAEQLVETVFFLCTFFILVLWLSSLVSTLLKRNKSLDATSRRLYEGVLQTLLLSVGVVAALAWAGVNLTILSVFSGVLGAALGFGLQSVVANYLSGFVVLAERSLRIGDLVRINDIQGRVEDIRARYTLLRSPDGVQTLVPNNSLVVGSVHHLTFEDLNIMLAARVGVAYRHDPDEVLAILRSVCAQVPRVLQTPVPMPLLIEYGDNSINYEVRFWINDSQNGHENVISAVNIGIWDAFAAKGIEIPFPQRVITVLPTASN